MNRPFGATDADGEDLRGAAAIYDDLLRRAGCAPRPGDISFTGADPVFPTVFPMADAGAAVIGAAATQAARLYELRTGRRQHATVAVDAASAAMRSWRYLRQVPEPPARGARAPVAFYETCDGRWFFLHRLAEHHLERELRVLGLASADDEDAVARAIRRWDAADLEEAVMAAGACAAMVRTHDEWAAHPQGRAVAAQPLFRITKIGDSDPIPAGSGDRPLGGIRVLDLTRVLAGPTAGRTLGEHGADVIRVNSPRYPDTLPMVQDTGHGKRSTMLDLCSATDAHRMRELVRGADVFAQGYRPGAIDRLGFSPEAVAALRPGVVVLSLSAFGTAGPWKMNRGFDSVVQAASGVALEMGHTVGDGTPRSMPGNPLDYITGYLSAFLVQVALERRASEGGSYHIEVSLAQTGRYLDRLPRIDAALAASRPAELSAARLAELMTERDTPYGPLRFLAPVAKLELTPSAWDSPTVPVDHDTPHWTST
ncbi:CoA transferase [Microbacterium sp. SYP-A9085]|uniref:CoA transferase n=1 Tax=Microbacterium sp. SYP-A9085 TaxID=2664454 RepID=UPI00129AAE67|nr:CoA transferase [Microbacterium sp. SYP-A9085]MRH28762.1 CoA transferase [Microbacterium sp. SYP-A9085]